MWQRMDRELAMATYHWLFLAQPGGLPETMIGADPAWWVREKLRRWAADPDAFAPEAVEEYVRYFSDPAAIHASDASISRQLVAGRYEREVDEVGGRPPGVPACGRPLGGPAGRLVSRP